MKLFYPFGSNPRLVHMFTLEKGIEIDSEEPDLLGGENRAEPYLEKNPGGAIPVLELDDDTPNLSVWFERMDARSSVNASKYPAAGQIALEISEMVPSLSAVAGSVSMT